MSEKELLSAMDVANQEFKRALRGYDQSEVDSFLDQVREAFTPIRSSTGSEQRRIQQLEEQMKEYRGLKDSLQEALLMAQRSAEERIRAAERQADAVIAEAQAKAEHLIGEARNQVETARRELARVRDVRRDLVGELRALLSRFDSLLETQNEDSGSEGGTPPRSEP